MPVCPLKAKQSLATLTKDVPKRHSLAMPAETVVNGNNQEWVMQADLPLTAAIRQSQQTLYVHTGHPTDRQGRTDVAPPQPAPSWFHRLHAHVNMLHTHPLSPFAQCDRNVERTSEAPVVAFHALYVAVKQIYCAVPPHPRVGGG